MKRLTLIAALATAPIYALADSLPVYDAANHELTYSGNRLTLNEYLILDGKKYPKADIERFGQPEFVVIDDRTKTMSLVYVSPEEYERAHGKNGVVPNRHKDDLVFTEDDADGLVFTEDEGLDTTQDMTFDTNEGLDTTTEMTFEEHEGSDLRDIEPTSSPGLTIVEQDGGPLDLFADEDDATIMPADGSWGMVIDTSEATGCPAAIAGQASAMLGLSNAMSLRFSKPKWKPTDISANYGQFKWSPVGDNGYYTAVHETSGEQAAQSGMAVLVSTALYAKSDSRIDIWNRITVNMSAFHASVAGSSQSCKIVVRGKLMRNQ